MNSRKLRVLALLLSAIMIFTAVPSTLFAEDFSDGEVVTWDDNAVVDEVETPTDDFGFDAITEAVAFDDGFGFEVADDALVAGDKEIDKEEWTVDVATKTGSVTVTYTTGETETVSAVGADFEGNCTLFILQAKPTIFNGTIYSSSHKVDGHEITLVAPGSIPPEDNYAYSGIYEDPTAEHKLAYTTTTIKAPSCKGATWDPGTKPGEQKWVNTSEDGKGSKIVVGTCQNAGCTYTNADSVTATVIPALTTHTEPEDKTKVTTSYYATAPTETVYDYSTGKEIEFDNATAVLKADKTVDYSKVPTRTNVGDMYYGVKTSYTCTVCGDSVEIWSQGSNRIKKVVYTNFSSNVRYAGAVPQEYYKETTYADDADGGFTVAFPEFDASELSLNGCSKQGTYDEVTYYGPSPDLDPEKKTVQHVIAPHSSVTTYYLKEDGKTNFSNEYPLGKVVIPPTPPTGLRWSYTNGDIDDLCIVTSVTNTDRTKTITKVGSGRTCEDVTYNKITICDFCHKVTEFEKPTAQGTGVHTKDDKYVKSFESLLKNAKSEDTIASLKTKWGFTDTIFNSYLRVDPGTANCDTKGDVTVSYKCNVCNKWIVLGTYNIALGHNLKWSDKEIKLATCYNDGYNIKENKCTDCNWVDTNAGTVTLILPKEEHIKKYSPKYSAFKIRVDKSGNIVGDGTFVTSNVGKQVMALPDGARDAALTNNLEVVNATIYRVCPGCNLEVQKAVYGKDNAAKDVKITLSALNKLDYSCNNGSVALEASYQEAGKTAVTDSGEYDFWKNIDEYHSRTQHAFKENADGSIVCLVCGETTKGSTIVTEPASESTSQETPAESTTNKEVPSESTSEETPAESSTKETPAESTTKEAPVEPTTAEPATMPAQVTGLKVTKNSPAKKVIAVKYKATKNADKYTINIRKAGTTAWTKNLTDGAVTTYEITGLTRGEAYDIRVAAIANGVAGPRSSHQYRWLEKVTLEKPKRVKGQNGAVIFSWNDVGATKYQVYYSADEAFKTGVKSGFVTGTSAKVTDLTPGTYYFKVRCFKTIDGITYTGAWSNVKSKKIK